jgi:pyruvate,water dikinase
MMSTRHENKEIYWFNEIGKEYNDQVGKKCANLGEMTRTGLPVPEGFALSIPMYERFLERTGVGEKVSQYMNDLGELKKAEITRLEEISRHIRNMIERQPMPKDMATEIVSYYEQLCNQTGVHDVPVSVRSAGTASRPGMFDTYLNIKGEENVVDRVKKVWSSSFTPRAISFRVDKEIPFDADKLGVAVVKMVNAKTAGIMFTLNPANGDPSKILIESNWGLGESVVSGEMTPDSYLVDKVALEILRRTISSKTSECVVDPDTGEVVSTDIPAERQNVQCLSDEEILELTRLGKLIERHYGTPQDIEWAIDKDLPFPQNVLLLQSRPETVWSRKKREQPLFKPRDNVLEMMVEQLKEGLKLK